MKTFKQLFLLIAMMCTTTAAWAADEAFVVWCSGNTTLYFDYGTVPSVGDTYKGQTVTSVWSGEDVANLPTESTHPGWSSSSDVKASCTNVVITPNFGNVKPTSCFEWFYNLGELTDITGLEYLDTSNVTGMGGMFGKCPKLASLDVSHFNTSNVIYMIWMFYGCSQLTELDLSHFDTSSTTVIRGMFYGCTGITRLNLKSFTTSQMTNMKDLFNGCTNLTTINVDESKWSTASVTESTDMFKDCNSLVGQNGTTYNSSYIDKTYARVDKAGYPGYLSTYDYFVNFVFNGKTVFSRNAFAGGTVSVPSVAEMESTYKIQDATFTYNDEPFTSTTPVNNNINVTIGGTLDLSDFSIAATKTTLNTGETTTVTVTPYYADYTLTSSKTKVATVVQDGTVTYVGPGTTTITATANGDPSKTASVVITCVSIAEVAIGDNATNDSYYVAYINDYRYSTSQQIYTPAEVGQAGDIKSIAFKVAKASSYSTSSVKIYLGHKNSSTFTGSSNYMTSSKLTLVYSGNPTLGKATGWEKLDFNQNGGKFEYNGTDNLVVVVCKSASSYTSDLTYYYTSVSNSTLWRRNDSYEDYANITNTSYSYNEPSSNRPSVKFWVEVPPTDFEIEEGVAYTRTKNIDNANVTYTRSFDTDRVGKYQAWFVPFDYTIKDTDLEKFDFFKINMIANAAQPGENPASDDVYIFLNPMAAGDVLYGNKPYVYRPKEAVTDYEFTTDLATLLAKTDASVLQTSTTTATYDFYGTYANTTATTENPFYYVSMNGNICKGTTVTVGPYRWILKATAKGGASYAPTFSFMENGTTGINEIQDSGFKVQGSETFYNLAGQRVSQPTKGLYIVNGRKVVIK